MVQRGAKRDAGAAIVADDGEARVAELVHERDDVGGHRALGGLGVPERVGRRRRAPVAAQVGQTTVWRSASSAATRCQVACVRGWPCSSTTGGPLPPWQRARRPRRSRRSAA
jgi:hypothetical protein